MKHITKIQIMAFAVILIVNCLNLKSQDTASVIFSEVKIKTSAQCEMCKERIEKAMSKTEGVAKSDLDVDTKILTVHYDSVLINPEEIRKVISKTGYDADDVPANEKAYKKLPKCCQKPEQELINRGISFRNLTVAEWNSVSTKCSTELNSVKKLEMIMKD